MCCGKNEIGKGVRDSGVDMASVILNSVILLVNGLSNVC